MTIDEITDKIIEIKCIDKEQIENFKKSIQSEHKILEKITELTFKVDKLEWKLI